MNILILMGLGLAAGALSGMGIGGGVVLIPALTMLFGLSQQGAQGINLVYFIPTAIIAVMIHKKGGRIEKQGLASMITGGILGAVAGSLLALAIAAINLRIIFASFLLVMGIYEFFKTARK